MAHIAVMGAGFAGLSAALELVERGHRVTVIEADPQIGGLAGGFEVDGHVLEKFYHHWFTSDVHVMELIKRLDQEERIVLRPSRTGMYYANQIFRLSNPVDLLRFKPLSLIGRIRLGLLVFQVKRVTDWKQLEHLTVKEWLTKLCGEEVYRVVWEPLMRGKFGAVADDISAVWFWNKLYLRGRSRGSAGKEMLAYYRGGFLELVNALAAKVTANGENRILTNVAATGIKTEGGAFKAVETTDGVIEADALLATPSLPIISDILEPHVSADYVDHLRRIKYLANVCLALELDRSLSDTYWINVNDPTFPFVGVIEHTNFEPPETYGGRHIVYLSKYLPATDAIYSMSDDELLEFAIPHIQRMFPSFDRGWVTGFSVWRADYAQPVVEREYSAMIPSLETPIENVFISTMAQVYPEDRGTNYAIRDGSLAGKKIAQLLNARACA